jgi:pentose-5-phosphate-3-epimerase
MLIIPAINTTNSEEAIGLVSRLEDSVLPQGFPLERIQVDINDGTFENIETITPEVLLDMDTKLKFDYHLMVSSPATWVERCIRGQADRIIGHIERMQSQLEFVEKVTGLGMKVGFGLDIDTPVEQVDESLLTSVDVILLVSYPAGAGGKKLEERVFEKIEKLVEVKSKDATPFKICLDGGVTLDNIKRIKLSGVDEVAITKRILAGDIEDNLEKFYKALY